ncbi:MAG: hypothetical protein ABIT16_09395 [Croceibacterium sp.]
MTPDRAFVVCALLAAPLLMGGSAPPKGADVQVIARLTRTYAVGPLMVTPQEVINDNRCPEHGDCPAPDRLRLRAVLDTPNGSLSRVLALGQRQTVAGGSLELADVRPAVPASGSIAPADYRFTLVFHPQA